jgi:predicted RNA-binding Zn-ribbon protein involved in translation (DUF1610 family)
MNIDEYCEQQDLARAVSSRTLRRIMGLDAKPFTQAQAEAFLGRGVSCPRCSQPVHPDSLARGMYCPTCGQAKRNNIIRWERSHQ